MKLQLSKSVTFEPSFNGNLELPENERIRITLLPLDQNGFITTSVALIELGIESARKEAESGAASDQIKKAVVSLEQARGVRNLFCDVVSKNIERIENLEINGAPATVDDLIREAVLLPLVIEITSKASDISNLTDEDVKN